jgi:outer membrane protein assembly factor BamB
VTTIHLPLAQDEVRRSWYTCCVGIAGAAAVFLGVVAFVLLISALREHREGLLVSQRLVEMKAALSADRKNEELKQAIRDLDESLRRAYFARRAFWARGAWLLTGGAVVLAVALKLAGDLSHRPHLPTGPRPIPPRLDRPMIWGMTSAVGALAVFLLVAWTSAPHTSTPADGPPAVAQEAAPADDAAMARNWPAFRGFGGIGITAGQYPMNWDGTTGQNIAWSTPVPMEGASSPIVWENQVFLTGGSATQREVYAFAVATGKLQWTHSLKSDYTGKVDIIEGNTWATPTMATDGARVFALFPTGELAALSLDGQLKWQKSLGVPRNQYGHAGSLMSRGQVLVVQWDQGMEASENLSVLIGFDTATGRELWRTRRPVSQSWVTPAIVQVGDRWQVVALGQQWITGHDLATGQEIWRAKGLEGELAASPTYDGRTIFAALQGDDLLALAPDGQGDVSKTHRKALEADNLPEVVSPVVVGERILLVSASNYASCHDTKTGKMLWEQEYPAGVHASPIAVGTHVYLVDNKGVAHILEMADQYKVLATNPLGQDVYATPAFAGGRIYVRGKKSLFCIAGGTP